jgi:hypothetical protein
MMNSILIATLLGGLAITGWAADQHKHNSGKETTLKPYPLKTCVVSKEKLGSMGEPYVHKHQDREIKFCCKGCLKTFNKAPAKYVKTLEEAEQKAIKQ